MFTHGLYLSMCRSNHGIICSVTTGHCSISRLYRDRNGLKIETFLADCIALNPSRYSYADKSIK